MWLFRTRANVVKIDPVTVRVALREQMDAALERRRAGRAERQRAAIEREAAKVREQMARDPLLGRKST